MTEESLLNSIVDEVNDDNIVAQAVNELEEEPKKESEPKMTDPSWQEFVMKQFEPHELDESGNPKVHGLRRVSRLLLGPILSSRVVDFTKLEYSQSGRGLFNPSTVVYEVVIRWAKDVKENYPAYDVVFSDIADVYSGNTDEEFLRYPSSTAATRAEARCLRKALLLQNISSEESTNVPLSDSAIDGLITESQINFINSLCSRCDIDVIKYINTGENKYKKIDDIPFVTAQKIVEHLSAVQNGKRKAPDNVSGYKKDWRK